MHIRLKPLAALLWPLSRLYGALAARERAAYSSGARAVTRLPVPVVVVGNVVAGGAGKTPTTLAIALAESAQLCLVGFARDGNCAVYAHPQLLVPAR